MLPLTGIRVIEFCTVAAGPYCGMLLADMGADVIKVEHPDGGDTMRAWPPITDGYSENFASLNRNKRSVALNLKDPQDLERARTLVLEAENFTTNQSPRSSHSWTSGNTVAGFNGTGYVEALPNDGTGLNTATNANPDNAIVPGSGIAWLEKTMLSNKPAPVNRSSPV